MNNETCFSALVPVLYDCEGKYEFSSEKQINNLCYKYFGRNGYKDVYYIPVNNRKPLLSSEDYVGDDTHPTAEGSRKFAEFLKDRVAKILNW